MAPYDCSWVLMFVMKVIIIIAEAIVSQQLLQLFTRQVHLLRLLCNKVH